MGHGVCCLEKYALVFFCSPERRGAVKTAARWQFERQLRELTITSATAKSAATQTGYFPIKRSQEYFLHMHTTYIDWAKPNNEVYRRTTLEMGPGAEAINRNEPVVPWSEIHACWACDCRQAVSAKSIWTWCCHATGSHNVITGHSGKRYDSSNSEVLRQWNCPGAHTAQGSPECHLMGRNSARVPSAGLLAQRRTASWPRRHHSRSSAMPPQPSETRWSDGKWWFLRRH